MERDGQGRVRLVKRDLINRGGADEVMDMHAKGPGGDAMAISRGTSPAGDGFAR